MVTILPISKPKMEWYHEKIIEVQISVQTTKSSLIL
uniref:Uncharacterized protein n=1 Tax=Arundo donax TaxID=35708 RepID=A0A0A8ZS89_ARUDO